MEVYTMPEEKKGIVASDRPIIAESGKVMQDILQKLETVSNAEWISIVDKGFIFGIPAANLIKCYDRIQNFVKINNISPVAQLKPVHDGPIHGGMFVEFRHVHLNNKIYPLSDAQHEALDKELARDFKISLKNVGQVKF